LALLTQNKAKLSKMLIIKMVFEKNANFFAENCQKSQTIVIPGTDGSVRLDFLMSASISQIIFLESPNDNAKLTSNQTKTG
jgi:hypothetical protein